MRLRVLLEEMNVCVSKVRLSAVWAGIMQPTGTWIAHKGPAALGPGKGGGRGKSPLLARLPEPGHSPSPALVLRFSGPDPGWTLHCWQSLVLSLDADWISLSAWVGVQLQASQPGASASL